MIFRSCSVALSSRFTSDEGIDEVLDGQQRLVAIRDFVNDKFHVDGNIQPADEKIKSLHKKFYSELPQDVRLSVILNQFEGEEYHEWFINISREIGCDEQRFIEAFYYLWKSENAESITVFTKDLSDKLFPKQTS